MGNPRKNISTFTHPLAADPFSRDQQKLRKCYGNWYRAGLSALISMQFCTKNFNDFPFYGLHGAAAMGFFRPLYHSSANRYYHPSPHEGAGGFCAIGFAEYTGLPGIVVTSSGPGVQNLHSAVQDAFFDSVPLLVLSANVPTDELGSMAFQCSDVVRDFASKTRSVQQVKDPNDLASAVIKAYFSAIKGRHGPYMIDVPADVLSAKVPFAVDNLDDLLTEDKSYDEDALGEALQQMHHARKPIILVGGGVKRARAWEQVRMLVERIGCPVVYTLKGKGVIPDDNADSNGLNLGLAGMYGLAAANHALHDSDLIIAIGTRFSGRTITDFNRFAQHAKIIHFDIDPVLDSFSSPLDKRRLVVRGNLRYSIGALSESELPSLNPAWINHIRELQNAYSFQVPNPTIHTERHGNMLNADYVIYMLNQFINKVVKPRGENPIFSTDVGNHQMLAARMLQVDNPRHYMTSGGFGTMGYGIPAAVGAMHANPDGLYVVVTGDLSIQQYSGILRQLTPHEAHDKRHLARMNMKIIVIDNSDVDYPCGDMVHAITQNNRGKLYRPHHHRDMDLAKIARGYGIAAESVRGVRSLNNALIRAFEDNRPYLLQVKVAPGQGIFPRMPKGSIAPEMKYHL